MRMYRIGLGRSRSGKILDRDTEWYQVSELEHAIQSARKSRKPAFYWNGRTYIETSIEQMEKDLEKLKQHESL